MSTKSKNLSHYDSEFVPNGESFSIAIVVSEWNRFITENLEQGALETLLKHGVKREQILIEYTPGSYELPYACHCIALVKKPHAIIALGSVIRGETPHFDFVCEAVAKGIMDVSLQTQIPVILGVLTDDNEVQARDRSGGKYGNKGVECAIAALKMAELSKKIKS